jgi:hypothetical protein
VEFLERDVDPEEELEKFEGEFEKEGSCWRVKLQ